MPVMNSRTLPLLAGFMVFALSLFSLPHISFYIEQRFPFAEEKETFVISPQYAAAASGSFKSFLADIFYIRGILAITDDFPGYGEKVDCIQKNFAMAVSLDPHLTEGYFFAGVVIVRDQESLKKGIGFLEKYRYLNPGEWKIPYWTGFNYFQWGDYLRAAQLYRQAALLPGAPKFLRSNPAMFYYLAEKGELGIVYLEGLLNSVREPAQLEWISIKLEWLKKLVYLEKKVKEFVSLRGYYPQSLDELVKHKIIPAIPDDPFGEGYYIEEDTGRVKSRFRASPEGPFDY